MPEWSYLNDHRSYWLNIVGRLRPDETPQHALASLNPLWISLRTSEFTLLHDQSAKARENFISRSQFERGLGC
jgi:putative ABC transport system permease protein